MRIRDKILLNKDGLCEHGPINIVIFGDSVSHGAVNGYLDYENVYWNRLRRKMNAFRDYVPINMINASVGGTTAKESVARLDRQVLIHCPDLVIVCFGLNDVNGPLDEYLGALREIFVRCAQSGAQVIFLTPNMLNTRVADDTPIRYREYAKRTAQLQNGGTMDRYMQAAVAVAHACGASVCDCYAEWKRMSETRDVTELLANRINHPIPEMHALFADALYGMILGEGRSEGAEETTMLECN